MTVNHINLGTNNSLELSMSASANVSNAFDTFFTLKSSSSIGAFAGRTLSFLNASLSYTMNSYKFVSACAKKAEGFAYVGTKSMAASAGSVFWGARDVKIDAQCGDLSMAAEKDVVVRLAHESAGNTDNLISSGNEDVIRLKDDGSCRFSLSGEALGNVMTVSASGASGNAVMKIEQSKISFKSGNNVMEEMSEQHIAVFGTAVEIQDNSVIFLRVHRLQTQTISYLNQQISGNETLVTVTQANIAE